MTPALITLLIAQSDPIVSIDVRARPLKEVLAQLSEATGSPHGCATSHANEVMLIRFKDRPVSEVRRKLAWALDAEWTQTESGWTLARTEARTREIEAAAKASRKKDVDAFFAKIREGLKKTPTPYSRIQEVLKPRKDEGYEANGPSSPLGYWTLQIWLSLGADLVASTPVDGYLTYSDRPNDSQRTLPAEAQRHLNSLAEETMALVQEAGPESVYRTYAKKPLKTIIKLFRLGSSYGIWLSSYGPSGEEIFSVTQTSSRFGTNTYTKPDELGKRAAAETFTLAPLLAEYERVRDPKAEVAGIMEPIKKTKASDALLGVLLNPEKFDPLSYWNTEAILNWAGEKGICVCIPDRFDFATRSCLQPGKFQLGKLKQIAEAVGAFKAVAEPNWFLGRPVNGPSSEATRYNREALGAFLRKSFDDKAETVDSYAAYRWKAGRQSVYFGFWMTMQKTLWRLGVEPLNNADSHPYETWALIGSMQKSSAVLQGGALLFYGQATPQQKALMAKMAESGVYLEPEPGSLIRDLQLDPSEWMSKGGLDAGASFAVIGAQHLAIKRHFDDPAAIFESVMSAEQVGKMYARDPKLDLSSLGSVVMGPRTQLLVQFKPTAGLVGSEAIEVSFGPVSKPFPAKELPAEFVQLAQAAWQAERRRVANGSLR